jgi:hypothetical protein
MKTLPVLLEAGHNQPSPGPAQLPDRFLWGNASPGHVKAHAASRWGMPLPELSAAAYDIGFVDYEPGQERMPILELYSDHYVKSLTLAVLELAFHQRAQITPGESLKIGEKQVALDDYSQAAVRFPRKDAVSYISLVDFLGATPLPPVKDRIVIVGLDVERFQPIRTPIGMVRPHRVFYYGLVSLYESLW